MIRYIEGKLLKKEEDRIVVLTNGVGYEILLPAIVRQTFNPKRAGEEGEIVKLYIYYHQTERQPKPLLIGFNYEPEKEFFERFIKVEDIGPPSAVKALVLPIPRIARAIEERDSKTLENLKGVGKRTADKIIATLQGKVGKFAMMREDQILAEEEVVDFKKQVEEVLVKDLGHKVSEAQRLIKEAILRNPEIGTPEELFEEVYRGQKEVSP
ncbi:MAG TPA: Holliday junction branch migration protein RuvA [Thermodesulfobacteriota bacterium]|nr:Holliday junction branch migration protein RuvA [Thermodesulfobacteriota bacterium]